MTYTLTSLMTPILPVANYGCDNAAENGPVFPGCSEREHWSFFDDPAEAKGSEEDKLSKFRRVRDEVSEKLRRFVSREM